MRSREWPEANRPTIVPTVTRSPRMQGLPPITVGLCVTRGVCMFASLQVRFSERDADVLKFRLSQSSLDGFMPSIGNDLPVRIAVEEVTYLLSMILADRQRRSRPHHAARVETMNAFPGGRH